MLWIMICMIWRGYYPVVFIKKHPDRKMELRVVSQFSAQTDKAFGAAMIDLGQQMVKGQKSNEAP